MRAMIRMWMVRRGIKDLKELAKLAGINYSTFQRHMRDGGLTEFEIDCVADVLRVTPALVEKGYGY